MTRRTAGLPALRSINWTPTAMP